MSRAAKLKLAVGVVVLAVFLLIMTALSSGAGVTLYALDDFIEVRDDFVDQRVKLTGQLDPDQPVIWDDEEIRLLFSLKGAEADESLPVIYDGLRPDVFHEDVEIVAEGSWDGEVLRADHLLVKCPSKYETEAEYEKRSESERYE